jgi:hypothetical protein
MSFPDDLSLFLFLGNGLDDCLRFLVEEGQGTEIVNFSDELGQLRPGRGFNADQEPTNA